jgi:hypothetical protein
VRSSTSHDAIGLHGLLEAALCLFFMVIKLEDSVSKFIVNNLQSRQIQASERAMPNSITHILVNCSFWYHCNVCAVASTHVCLLELREYLLQSTCSFIPNTRSSATQEAFIQEVLDLAYYRPVSMVTVE